MFNTFYRLEKERNSCRQFEKDMEKLQNKLMKVQKAIPLLVGQGNGNLTTKDAKTQTELKSFISVQNETNVLNQEKQDLSGLVQEQRWRIEQLTSKVLQLSRKLEETSLKRFSMKDAQVPVSSIRILNTNTIISESSSTEDILQDAKMRLRRLEEESMKADQYYFDFKTHTSR